MELRGTTKPDLVVETQPFTMSARGRDGWPTAVVPTGLTEPRWVRAIEIRPSTVQGRRIVHHVTSQVEQESLADSLAADELNVPEFFMEWAVGKQGELMRPDSGRR